MTAFLEASAPVCGTPGDDADAERGTLSTMTR